MSEQVILWDETRSTSRHQITIPHKIWKHIGARKGARFIVKLLSGNKIILEEKTPDLDFSSDDWEQLKKLAGSQKNKGDEIKNFLRK